MEAKVKAEIATSALPVWLDGLSLTMVLKIDVPLISKRFMEKVILSIISPQERLQHYGGIM